ncbi:MAG: acetate--CoA ligase [Acidimicrobiales bacterium]|nr:acetate--CoA ligase [Acidimicrobiales bacterium]
MSSTTRDESSIAAPNLADYGRARVDFDWSSAAERLEGLGDGHLNIAHEAVDRHARNDRADHVAIRWLPKRGESVDLTYGDLQQRTSQFADALTALCGRGARVATLAGRVPELYVAALGTLKAGGVYSPLFSAFGPEPIRQRVDLGEIEVLVTTPVLYRRKVAPIRAELASLKHVVLIGGDASDGEGDPVGGVIGWDDFVATGSPDFPAVRTAADELALLHFTSGTTGTPKGAMHVHGAVVAHMVTAEFALDLHPDDVFWCTADPGWVTGTSYGIIAPLVHGVTCIIDEGDFDADRWYGTIAEQRVTVWYTAPTAIRMMMRVGLDPVRSHDLSSLRVIASVGEPLNPEAVVWGQEAFGQAILDNWWQTETGGIMIANYRAVDVKPGSMGRPIPGVDITLLARTAEGEPALDDDGNPVEITTADEVGELAIRAGWPSMFIGYLGMDERYAKAFIGPWYRSGDLARRDADGYYWFVGRSDDVIKSAGHLIGPFEVESTLIEHPAVSEAGVIGLPDPTAGEIVKAYVSLAPGYEPDEDLQRDIMAFARKKLGPAVAPRLIDLVDQLPKTRSGKIMRRLLKARELGLPEGDTSTLEGAGQ